jgi:hypothetical protein
LALGHCVIRLPQEIELSAHLFFGEALYVGRTEEGPAVKKFFLQALQYLIEQFISMRP